MIRPLRKNDALLADIREAGSISDELHIWWLGQSGFLVQWSGIHVLFDPYLSDSLTKKYASTDKPHTRMTELAVDPARLDFIDVVTSSHNHTDHLDGETLGPLLNSNGAIQFLIPEANRDFVSARLGTAGDFPTGLNASESVALAGVRFTGITAAHNEVDRNEAGQCNYMGFVANIGPWTVYHSGDTLMHEGLEASLKPHNVDIALLPINGNKPERRVAGNLDGLEAAALAKTLGAQMVVPCHYDMFEFNTETTERFEESCREIGQPFKVLQCGERLGSSKLDAPRGLG
jgi:L-ascorbate metabolism protein UlaG (beta-lactamase superfamily)